MIPSHLYHPSTPVPVAAFNIFRFPFLPMLWGFLVFLSGLPFSPDLRAETDEWQVRRKNRRPILIRRYQTILRNQPFAEYALRQLWSMHRKSKAQIQLISWYQQRVHKYAHASDQIVLARLWERSSQWQKALTLYRKIPQPSHQKSQFQLAEIRCLLGLKQPEQALRILQKILNSIPPQSRRSFLQQALQQILASGSNSGIPPVQALLQQQTWNREQKLQIARWFAQYHHWALSMTWYQQALLGLSGQPKMLLLLEIIRHQITARQFSQALVTIQTARTLQTRHSWLAWELLQQEVLIFRAQKRLPLLVAQLDRQWQNTHNEQKLQLLAQLYDELQIPSQAIPFYLRILKRNPSARHPRLRLLFWYSKQQKMDDMQHHLRLLIQYKNATHQHFLQFAKDLLKRSGREVQLRWNPYWTYSYACQNNRRYRFYRKYVYGRARRYYHNTASQHRCNRQQWNHFRQKRWQYWTQHQATPAQKRMVSEAIRLLEQCAKQYPHQWDTLQQIEELLSQHGYSQIAQRVRQKMIRAVDAYVYQVETTYRLLYQEEEKHAIAQVAHRALRPRGVPLKRAVELASFIYQYPQDPSIPPQKRNPSTLQRERNRWQQNVCPKIVGFLRPVWKRLQPTQAQQDPILTLHLHALLQRCGMRSIVLQNSQHRIEQTLQTNTEQRNTMVRLYLRYQLHQPLQRLFRSLHQKNPHNWLSQFHSLWQPSIKPRDVLFFLKQLMKTPKNWAQQATALHQIFAKICQYKTSCIEIRPVIEQLVMRPDMPMTSIVSMLSQLQRHQLLLGKTKRDTLAELIKTRRNKVYELQQLAKAQSLFYFPYEVKELHRALLIYVLEHRTTPPSNALLWANMLQQHLRSLRPLDPKHRMSIQRINQVTSKFPAIYRHILSFYVTHYTYRHQYGIPKILKHLNTTLTLDDLPILEKIYQYLPYNQRPAFFSALKIPTDRPEILGWLYLFAKKFALFDLQIKALLPLTKLRPHEEEWTIQLALAFDRSPTQSEQAEQFWLQWLRKKPHLFSLQAIQDRIHSCCADRADQRQLRRLLVLAAQTHGIKMVWKHIAGFVKQLDPAEKSPFLRSLLQIPHLSPSTRIQLADLAQQYQLHAIVVSVYTPLVKSANAPLLWHKQLAQALDQGGKIQQADPHWRIYFRSMPRSRVFTSLQDLGKSWQQQNLPRMARLAYYRAWVMGSSPPADATTQIAALQKSGKHLQAWSLWLATQSEKVYRCLSNHATPIVSFSIQSSQLWKLQIPYQGSLALFPPCAWTLPPLQTQEIVQPLAAYLQKNPNISITLTASADPQLEPDATFLAQQRAQFLADALIKHGVPDQRIATKTVPGHSVCTSATIRPPSSSPRTTSPNLSHVLGSLSPTHQAILPSHPCSSYQRQVGIAHKSSATPTNTRYTLSLTQDSDRDGVPDVYDRCPLQSGKLRYRPRSSVISPYRGGTIGSGYYRRNPLALRSFGGTVTGSLTTGVSSLHSGHQRLPKFGCPLYPRPLQLLRIQDGILHLQSEIKFYRRSPAIMYQTSQTTLLEIAALLQMVPALGVLHIHINPYQKPAYDHSYYRPYRHYRKPPSSFGFSRRSRSTWKKLASPAPTYHDRYLANQRVLRLRNYLISLGVPTSRIRTHVHTDKPKQLSGYVVLRLPSSSNFHPPNSPANSPNH